MNFVDFTSTLVREVFRTLVDTSREQLETYVGMVEQLSGGVDRFISTNVGNLDDAALRYLNEVVRPTYTTDPSDYTRTVDGTTGAVTFTPTDVTLIPTQVNALTSSFSGVTVNIDTDPEPDELTEAIVTTGTDTTVSLASLHAFAKEMMRRAGQRSFDELQALLRIGLARVVPNSGFIETAMTFSIDTSETSESSRDSRDTNTTSSSGSFSLASEKTSQTGLFGRIFGDTINKKINIGVNAAASNTRLRVNVVHEKSTAATNLDIDITGRVRINFITDYFPLLPPAPAPVGG
jgi:hypothetical protein